MFQHLPCRNLRCFLLVTPLVIGSISSHQRQGRSLEIFYKVVRKFGRFLRLYYPFQSLSFSYCFVFPLDIFACSFSSYRTLCFFLRVILSYSYFVFILFAWHLFIFYFFSIIEFKTASRALISSSSWLTRFDYKNVLIHII